MMHLDIFMKKIKKFYKSENESIFCYFEKFEHEKKFL